MEEHGEHDELRNVLSVINTKQGTIINTLVVAAMFGQCCIRSASHRIGELTPANHYICVVDSLSCSFALANGLENILDRKKSSPI